MRPRGSVRPADVVVRTITERNRTTDGIRDAVKFAPAVIQSSCIAVGSTSAVKRRFESKRIRLRSWWVLERSIGQFPNNVTKLINRPHRRKHQRAVRVRPSEAEQLARDFSGHDYPSGAAGLECPD